MADFVPFTGTLDPPTSAGQDTYVPFTGTLDPPIDKTPAAGRAAMERNPRVVSEPGAPGDDAIVTPWEKDKYKGKKLQFPELPTTAELDTAKAVGMKQSRGTPFSNIKDVWDAPGDHWRDFSSKFGSLMTGSMGPLFTDNPRARQQIYAKHLPGVKETTDIYGNPMIEHDDKRYYTDKPGMDAMDVARAGMSTAVGAPTALIAPAGIAVAAGTGALLAGGQSLLEDAITREAGGTDQPIDLPKAGISALIGGGLPLGLSATANAIMPRIRAAAANTAGGLTARAQRALGAAIPENTPALAPQQLRELGEWGRQNGWSPESMQAGVSRILGEEFHVPVTSGQQTGNAVQLRLEDQLRQGGKGDEAHSLLREYGEGQRRAATAAGERLRAAATEANTPLTPEQIGTTLSEGYRSANTAARNRVTQAYTDAFDPTVLQARNIPLEVPRADVRELQPALFNRFGNQQTGEVMPITEDLHPRAMAAIRYLNEFSESGRLPNAFPGAPAPPVNQATGPMNWRVVDAARKHISGLREAAHDNPADQRALGMIMDTFDEQFGRSNPALNDARQLHRARMERFEPNDRNAVGINPMLEAMQNSENPGQVAFNILTGSTPMKKGEGVAVVNRLRDIYDNNPQAMAAMREGMLARVLVDPKTGQNLTAVNAANALQKALDGAEGDVYRALFHGTTLDQMGRFQYLMNRVGRASARDNPSGTSYPIMKALTKSGPEVVGGLAGAGLAHLSGIPGAEFAGAYVGSKAGDFVAEQLGSRAANKAMRGDLPYWGVRRRPVPLPYGQMSDQDSSEGRTRGGYLRRAIRH